MQKLNYVKKGLVSEYGASSVFCHNKFIQILMYLPENDPGLDIVLIAFSFPARDLGRTDKECRSG